MCPYAPQDLPPHHTLTSASSNTPPSITLSSSFFPNTKHFNTFKMQPTSIFAMLLAGAAFTVAAPGGSPRKSHDALALALNLL